MFFAVKACQSKAVVLKGKYAGRAYFNWTFIQIQAEKAGAILKVPPITLFVSGLFLKKEKKGRKENLYFYTGAHECCALK